MLLKNTLFLTFIFVCLSPSNLLAMDEEENPFNALLDLSNASLDNGEIVFNPLSPKKPRTTQPAAKYNSPAEEVDTAVLRAFTFDMELIQQMDQDQHRNAHSKIVSFLKKALQENAEYPKIENFYTETLVKAVNEADNIMPRMNSIPFLCNQHHILEYYTYAYGPDDRKSYYSVETVEPAQRAQKAAKEYLNQVTKPISSKILKIALKKLDSTIQEYDELRR